MKPVWRFIDTGPLDPFTNMAFDETLLRSFEDGGAPPTFRTYGWQPAGISLGYAQDPRDVLDLDACRKRSMPFVRRLTGGGIIIHGDELTYSFVCGRQDLGIAGPVIASYKTIASFLIDFYAGLGIGAIFACDAPSNGVRAAPSPLCFSGREKYDIIAGGRKLGGSAQKRSRKAVFQHGSIPLRIDTDLARSFTRDRGTPGDGAVATSLEEVLGRAVARPELVRRLAGAFASTFGVEVRPGDLSGTERRLCAELKSLKYESSAWNYERIDATTARQRRPAGAAALAR